MEAFRILMGNTVRKMEDLYMKNKQKHIHIFLLSAKKNFSEL